MTKKENLENPNSCLNHAADDEPIFVLRGKDIIAPKVVEAWAMYAGGIHEIEKVDAALDVAVQMRAWLKANM